MSGFEKIDLKKIKAYSIKSRKHKVSFRNFQKLDNKVPEIRSEFRRSQISEISDAVIKARNDGKKIIVMMGAHPIKCGLSFYLIDLMRKGFIHSIAGNGAVAIHDTEIALIGETSEDVQSGLKEGSFGMVEDTARIINDAIKNGSKENLGFGESLQKELLKSRPIYKEYSVLYNAALLKIPVTIHVAIGTDTIHQHPSFDGALTGKATYNDFLIFTKLVSELEDGVIINFGSAVIMPEVFLKALNVCRNLGYKIENFTAANFDMKNHYRPYYNITKRPGGKGYYVVAQHKLSIPSLYKELMLKWKS